MAIANEFHNKWFSLVVILKHSIQGSSNNVE